jgi:predicted transcriptional regulator
MPAPQRRDRGALEAEVIAALGATGHAMTAREVQAELGDSLAYTTVMTTLARLHEKGALTRHPSGRAFAYGLAGDADAVDAALTARRMRKVLDSGTDRSVALSRFVSELDPDDERLLVDLLRDLDAERRSDGPG